MLNIEHTLGERYPKLFRDRPLLSRPFVATLRLLFHESEVNRFLDDNADLTGFDFLEQVLEHFNFSYSVSNRDRDNIPASGRVVIVANHPLGALDALALIQLISEIRKDVVVVANELLSNIHPLKDLFLPVDNLDGASRKDQIRAIQEALSEEKAVIFFPAGEVSRLRPNGIRDGRWNSGFLRFAKRSNAPVLPVHIKARNSSLFYGVSALYKPLSALLLVQEMFMQKANTIGIRIGAAIPQDVVRDTHLSRRSQVRLFKRHLYRVGRGKNGVFRTENTIAHPQPRQLIKAELKRAKLLGATRDDKAIYLFDYKPESALMKEIGRLRELSFRKVGEGSGQKRDLDRYDQHYRHLVLWDHDQLEIVGAYRIGETSNILANQGVEGLYTDTLFDLSQGFEDCATHALELGRSFVQPAYWGSRALDYLWQGIGAYVKHHPHIQHLYGPVSISDSYPEAARNAMIRYYTLYYGQSEDTLRARLPYTMNGAAQEEVAALFSGNDSTEDFKTLRAYLGEFGLTVPTLYKQYTDVTEAGGTHFLGFNVDPEFSNVVDGLICVDLTKLKASKRQRYIGTAETTEIA